LIFGHECDNGLNGVDVMDVVDGESATTSGGVTEEFQETVFLSIFGESSGFLFVTLDGEEDIHSTSVLLLNSVDEETVGAV